MAKKEYAGEEFSGLRLEEGGFHGILFEDCLFADCRFQGLSLHACQFTGCHFARCRLGGLQFDNVQAMGNSFEDCAVLGLDWSALLDPRKQDLGFLPFDSFARCTLHHCVFFHLDLRKFSFAGCDLSGSFFEGCKLNGAAFPGCLLRGTAFSHNDLSDADFREASEYGFSIEGNQVKGAKFSMPEAVNLLYGLGLEIDGG